MAGPDFDPVFDTRFEGEGLKVGQFLQAVIAPQILSLTGWICAFPAVLVQMGFKFLTDYN
jgi:hypothetical protein